MFNLNDPLIQVRIVKNPRSFYVPAVKKYWMNLYSDRVEIREDSPSFFQKPESRTLYLDEIESAEIDVFRGRLNFGANPDFLFCVVSGLLLSKIDFYNTRRIINLINDLKSKREPDREILKRIRSTTHKRKKTEILAFAGVVLSGFLIFALSYHRLRSHWPAVLWALLSLIILYFVFRDPELSAYREGVKNFENRNFKRAEKFLKKAEAKIPDYPELLYYLCQVYLQTDRHELARKYLRKLIKTDSNILPEEYLRSLMDKLDYQVNEGEE